jgi:hypothetical protein
MIRMIRRIVPTPMYMPLPSVVSGWNWALFPVEGVAANQGFDEPQSGQVGKT